VHAPIPRAQSRNQLPTIIRAELRGDHTCTALGITICAYAPVLELCRKLIAAGHDPATPLDAYRGETLCLHVLAIGEAAQLEINAKGSGFIARRAVRTAPPIAPIQAEVPEVPPTTCSITEGAS
jgi:hypothetical protein